MMLYIDSIELTMDLLFFMDSWNGPMDLLRSLYCLVMMEVELMDCNSTDAHYYFFCVFWLRFDER